MKMMMMMCLLPVAVGMLSPRNLRVSDEWYTRFRVAWDPVSAPVQGYRLIYSPEGESRCHINPVFPCTRPHVDALIIRVPFCFQAKTNPSISSWATWLHSLWPTCSQEPPMMSKCWLSTTAAWACLSPGREQRVRTPVWPHVCSLPTATHLVFSARVRVPSDVGQ